MTVCDKRTVSEARSSLWRSRWAAIGAAVAVSVGAGGMFVAQAAPGTAESTIVSVTPERILDTRNGNDVGLAGPFVSAVAQKLQVTGSIPTATGAKTVVPAGATGVLLNVTPVGPTAAAFISIRPGDATGAASTSSLNFTAGAISPNSVQVAMPTSGANAGKIDITFDAYGVVGPTTDVLIDVVGYTTNTGLQELVADVATKASTASVNAASALKADKAVVAALPAAYIFAAGRVSSTGTKNPFNSPEFGSWSVTRTGVGSYSLVLPGGCNNTGGGFKAGALVQLTRGFNGDDGEIVLGGGDCPGQQVTYDVFLSDSAGVPEDGIWQFMAMGPNSLVATDVDSVVTDGPGSGCASTDCE